MRSLDIALVAGAVLSGWAMQSSTAAPAAAAASPCENLTSLRPGGGRVTLAQMVAPGGFTLPTAGRGGAPNFSDLPAFCRVAATLTPSSDSDIKIEVWLPARRLERQISGGRQRRVGRARSAIRAMADALRRGYATSSTDTGQSAPGASFALGHPEKLIDFGYRVGPRDDGGGEGDRRRLLRHGAARFRISTAARPAGGRRLRKRSDSPPTTTASSPARPPHIGTRTLSGVVWVGQSALKDSANAIPASKYPLIHKAVLDACDALDGVKDGLIENPTRRAISIRRCCSARAPTAPGCLTPPR